MTKTLPRNSPAILTRDEAAERYGDMAAMMMFREPAGPWSLRPVGGNAREAVRTVVATGGELVAVLASEGR